MNQTTIITKDNLDETTVGALQKYMEDHGVVDLRMARQRVGARQTGWVYTATLVNGVVLTGGPLPEMSDCMKKLIHKLEEA